ncbi:unnamed protein product, partial [Pylaiella littoralis]
TALNVAICDHDLETLFPENRHSRELPDCESCIRNVSYNRAQHSSCGHGYKVLLGDELQLRQKNREREREREGEKSARDATLKRTEGSLDLHS